MAPRPSALRRCAPFCWFGGDRGGNDFVRAVAETRDDQDAKNWASANIRPFWGRLRKPGPEPERLSSAMLNRANRGSDPPQDVPRAIRTRCSSSLNAYLICT